MQLGVVTSALAGHGFAGGLDLAREIGCGSIEVACAGYESNLAFGDPTKLAEDDDARARWLHEIGSRGLEISALALHGQPLSPDPAAAMVYREQFRAACRLASLVQVSRLTLLAGLPEGADGDRTPCWIASAFPPTNHAALEWQWDHRVIPYWTEQGAFAEDHGCVLCFEMHPGDVVYNPLTLERLHDAVGEVIACNYDPSHLVWQGIDAIDAIARLAPLIRHVHAKDTGVRPYQVRRDGILTAVPMSDVAKRPWNFRTIGHGHDELFWRRFVAALIEAGYDDVLSIEHEDEYLDSSLGLVQAAGLLRGILSA